jgi:hypothetical protein
MTGQADLERRVPDAALHLTNGDVTVDLLRRAGLARSALAWADVLHEGPVPAGLDDDGLRRARAEFLAGADGVDAEGVRRRFEGRDRALAANRGGTYVLWFEADLYDQLQIAQILAMLGDLGVAPDRVTLICIGEYPGIAHFGGLGELQPEQLPGLLDVATPLTAAALELGAAAWAALRAPDPAGLGPIAASRSRELRFLGEAFDRLSREYPSTRDGLSLTERRALAATPGGGATAGTVFARLAEREARPFLGDRSFFQVLARLAGPRVPLVELDPPGPVTAATRVLPTGAGGRVLAGEADHVALNGIDRWVGGVHLQGAEARWRWDEGTEAIAS